MRKLFRLFDILALGAGLSMAVVSCQREEFIETPQDEATPIHISVGAGFANDPATRSAVVTDDVTGTRTLTFTDGDRLYIVAEISGTDLFLSGYLAVESISPDGTSATFVGDYGDDLIAYYKDIQEIEEEGDIYEVVDFIQVDHDFNSEDIFGECEDIVGVLVHEGAGDNDFIVSSEDLYYYYFDSGIKATVEDVMEQCLLIEGGYNPVTNGFVLGVVDTDLVCAPILNCRVSGLEPNTSYIVRYMDYGIEDEEESGTLGTLTTGENEEVTFACYIDWAYKASLLRTLVFIDENEPYERKLVVLGKKALGSKVYNITREAVSFKLPQIDGESPDFPDNYGMCSIYGWGDDMEVTFSDTSEGFSFYFDEYNSATVTLNTLVANVIFPEFLHFRGDAIINVSGENSISNQVGNYSIDVDGSLKLAGKGTLTITCAGDEYCGIASEDYQPDNSYEDFFNSYEDTGARDVSAQLAAEGYKVIRSARKDNEDGTYTWTYYVGTAFDISSLEENGHYDASDFDIITGTNNGNVYISVPDGATVTLYNVNLNTPDDHAGVHCAGDATVILCGNNWITVDDVSDYPGIFIPNNHTLIVCGTGSLSIDAYDSDAAAGIGGGDQIDCGDIIISDCTLDFIKISSSTAGIGSGWGASCGNITLINCTIKDIQTEFSPGIGCGAYGSCGDITIGSGCMIGNYDENSDPSISRGIKTYGSPAIGAGEDSQCGAITISEDIKFARIVSTWVSTPVPNCVGSFGSDSSCGTVTIAGETGVDLTDPPAKIGTLDSYFSFGNELTEWILIGQ